MKRIQTNQDKHCLVEETWQVNKVPSEKGI